MITVICFSQSIIDTPYVVNGTLHTIVFNNNTIYIGGMFSHVGTTTGCMTVINAETMKPDLSFPKVSGTVYSIESDGLGGYYIGGDFNKINGIERNNIAHIKPDKTLNTHWDPNANGIIKKIAVLNNIIYVCGYFTQISETERKYLAALDATTGKIINWDPNPNSYVNTFDISGDNLFVGGYFTKIGDSLRNRIAAINVITGETASWSPDANNEVSVIKIYNGIIYVTGYFTTIGGQLRKHIAAIDMSDGKPTNWNPLVNNIINDLAFSGSIIYAVGSFDSIGIVARKCIAAIDVATGNVTSWYTSIGGPRSTIVTSIAVRDSMIYVGGNFTYIGGKSRNSIAALDAITGNATNWDPNVIGGDPARDIYPIVHSLLLSGSKIVLGGTFRGIGGITRNNIASLDALTGKPRDWNPNANGPVFALTVYDSVIYAGGDFTIIGGVVRRSLSELSVSTGNATAWQPNIDSPYPFVRALAASDTIIYIGGTFESIDGIKRNNIAAINRLTGKVMDWNPNANRLVSGIINSSLTIYIRGTFTSVGGNNRKGIAAIDAITGNVLNWNPNVNGTIHELAVSDSKIFIAGNFTNIDGTSRNNLAAFNRLTGEITEWNPNANGAVYCLTMLGSRVYAGGKFNSIGTQNRNYLAELDTSTGNATSWNPYLYGYVSKLTLDSINRRIYVFDNDLGIVGHNLNQTDFVQKIFTSPEDFTLLQNYPNPFNQNTYIEYYLPQTAHVNLKIYNQLGQIVATLVNEKRYAGKHRIIWEPSNLSSGIYFCKMSINRYVLVKKIVLIK